MMHFLTSNIFNPYRGSSVPAKNQGKVLHFRGNPPPQENNQPVAPNPEPINLPIDLGNEFRKRMDKAVQAAKVAGAIIMKYFNKPEMEVSSKANAEVVTNADKEADEAIQGVLKEAFPEDTFLTEESYDPQANVGMKSAWIVDPLDATRNFANNIPHFAVSIAYVKDGKPEVGVIYDPVKDEMFTAIAGQEVTMNGQPIKTSVAATVDKTILSMPYPIPKKFLETKIANRRMGCSALDMAYVAAGRYGAASERNLKVWDIAAGIPMVETAGGKVSDFHGQPIDVTQSQQRVSYIASNTKLHDKMLDLTKD